MTNFLLLHGAASTGWLWHRVIPELQRAGAETVAPDLPCSDPTADLHTYVDVACDAAARFGNAPLTLVAQSMAGLMAPVVAARRPVERIVLVAAMIPRPGETGMQWWQATGQVEAQRDYLEALGYSVHDTEDPEIIYVHDFDAALKDESLQHLPQQYSTPLETPVPFEVWPEVPIHAIAFQSDRLFPVEFMRQQALERLGVSIDVIPGGHLAALTQPGALAALLLAYQHRGRASRSCSIPFAPRKET